MSIAHEDLLDGFALAQHQEKLDTLAQALDGCTDLVRFAEELALGLADFAASKRAAVLVRDGDEASGAPRLILAASSGAEIDAFDRDGLDRASRSGGAIHTWFTGAPATPKTLANTRGQWVLIAFGADASQAPLGALAVHYPVAYPEGMRWRLLDLAAKVGPKYAQRITPREVLRDPAPTAKVFSLPLARTRPRAPAAAPAPAKGLALVAKVVARTSIAAAPQAASQLVVLYPEGESSRHGGLGKQLADAAAGKRVTFLVAERGASLGPTSSAGAMADALESTSDAVRHGARAWPLPAGAGVLRVGPDGTSATWHPLDVAARASIDGGAGAVLESLASGGTPSPLPAWLGAPTALTLPAPLSSLFA